MMATAERLMMGYERENGGEGRENGGEGNVRVKTERRRRGCEKCTNLRLYFCSCTSENCTVKHEYYTDTLEYCTDTHEYCTDTQEFCTNTHECCTSTSHCTYNCSIGTLHGSTNRGKYLKGTCNNNTANYLRCTQYQSTNREQYWEERYSSSTKYCHATAVLLSVALLLLHLPTTTTATQHPQQGEIMIIMIFLMIKDRDTLLIVT